MKVMMGWEQFFRPFSFNMKQAQRELLIMIVMLELLFSIVNSAPF